MGFLSEGGVLGEENSPQPPFYLTRSGCASPGELTFFFELLKASLKTGILTSLRALDCVLHAALLLILQVKKMQMHVHVLTFGYFLKFTLVAPL